MLYLLCSLLVTINPEAFRHFKKSGNQAVCLVNYADKTVSCDYKTMNECRAQYDEHKIAVCFPRKGLKLGDE